MSIKLEKDGFDSEAEFEAFLLQHNVMTTTNTAPETDPGLTIAELLCLPCTHSPVVDGATGVTSGAHLEIANAARGTAVTHGDRSRRRSRIRSRSRIRMKLKALGIPPYISLAARGIRALCTPRVESARTACV